MRNGLRKIAGYIACAMLLIFTVTAVVPMSALAEEERYLLYLSVPDDWEEPCVWAWSEDGATAYDAWPGEEAESDAANDGWYYIYVPSWADHVIVNANDGEVQTDEQILDGSDTWVTVTDAETVEATTEKQTDGDAPEYVEKFVVHASVDESWGTPGLWAWSAPDGTNAFEAWPGLEMKAGDDGWYTAKAPTFVNSIIINGNDGEVQTDDISIDPAELWVTVSEDGEYDLSYVDPEKAAVGNITVYVSAPAEWSEPALWAWSAPDGTNVFANWPGETLEDGDGWLVKSVPGWVNSLIVNGNGGEVQTSDISIEAGKDVWLVVSGAEDAYEVYYEEPEIVGGAANEKAADSEATDSDGTESTADTETVESASGGANVPLIGGIAAVVAAAGVGTGVYVKNRKK